MSRTCKRKEEDRLSWLCRWRDVLQRKGGLQRIREELARQRREVGNSEERCIPRLHACKHHARGILTEGIASRNCRITSFMLAENFPCRN